jgi:hypothetical protein
MQKVDKFRDRISAAEYPLNPHWKLVGFRSRIPPRLIAEPFLRGRFFLPPTNCG